MGVRWKQDQPILLLLRVALVEQFPFLTRLGYSTHWSGIGGFVDRTTRSGGPSAHAEGRAADIYLSAFEPYEKMLGDGLLRLFGSNLTPLGVDHVIWNRQIWSAEKGGPRRYENKKNGPHTDHVHVAFTRAGSQKQPPLLSKLVRDLRWQLDFTLRTRLSGLETVRHGRAEWNSPFD
ncbi:MAG: hypothetical protein R3B81_03165 [bacterium]